MLLARSSASPSYTTRSVECAPISTTATPRLRSSPSTAAYRGGHRLENRFFYREVRMMNGIHQRLMLMHGSGDHVHVRFEARAHDTSRISVSCTAVQREVLRGNLQHYAIFHQSNLRRQFDRVIRDRPDRSREAARIRTTRGC